MIVQIIGDDDDDKQVIIIINQPTLQLSICLSEFVFMVSTLSRKVL